MIENLFKITTLIVVTSSTIQSNYIETRTNCYIQTVNRNSTHTKTIIDFDFAYKFFIISQIIKHV